MPPKTAFYIYYKIFFKILYHNITSKIINEFSNSDYIQVNKNNKVQLILF